MSTLEAFLNHPIETLERALHIRKQIDQLNETLKELFGPTPMSLAGVQTTAPKKRGRPPKVQEAGAIAQLSPGADEVKAKRKKKGMSAEGRAKIAAAQKARWAKSKGEKTEAAAEQPKSETKKRKLSPESRARVVAAQKARREREKKANG